MKAVIVTRSSCEEQSQVFVSPHRYFLRPQPGWSWAAIPYESCYCHKKLLRGAVAGFCISSSILLETPNRGGVGKLSPIKAVIVTRSSCAEQSQVFVSPRQYFLRSQPGWSWAAIPYESCYCHKKLLRGAVAGFCISSSILLETPNRGGVVKVSPIKAVIVTRSSCAEQSQVFVSPRRYFLRPQPGWSWAAIPYESCYCHKKLLRGAVAGFCISSSILLATPNRGGVGKLSPIKAVIVTRSSCAEQSQVFVSPRQYFLIPQPGWSWAAIPYKSCYCHKKLLRGADAGCCIYSSVLLETPSRVGVGQHHQYLTIAGQALLLCRRFFLCFEINIWTS